MNENLVAEKSIFVDIKKLVENGRTAAYNSVNVAMISTYWSIGRRIVEEEQHGKGRAQYGEKLISMLAVELTKEFGSGFSTRNLYHYVKFYQCFPDYEILHARVQNLSWTHIRSILRVDDENARIWYLTEAAEQNWSARTLDRNIGTQYYHRLLRSPQKDAVKKDMAMKSKSFVEKKFELLKNPLVAEFLGFKPENSLAESDLEGAILSHIRDFLMEMGRGFAFVSRQQRIVTDTRDYFIDLVFYNIELKCYVLVDLKIGTVTHQDVGQMDMYVRMYDELKCRDGDNPTIGVLLCSETSEDIARFSILRDNDNIFMAKYLTYLPTKEQLKREIEAQKQIFYLQHPTVEN